jgi:hypothetical protein
MNRVFLKLLVHFWRHGKYLNNLRVAVLAGTTSCSNDVIKRRALTLPTEKSNRFDHRKNMHHSPLEAFDFVEA